MNVHFGSVIQFISCVFHLITLTNATCRHSQMTSPFQSEENATYYIGGIFPIHYYNVSAGRYLLNPPGISWVEAMLLSIEEINNSSTLLPNITLGYKIYDGCNSVNKTLESVLQVVEGFQRYDQHNNCTMRNNFNPAIALIGGASSKTASKMAAVLSASQTPLISYSSTSTDLTANYLYPSFVRTIPPDNYQAQVISQLLKTFNWTFVNIVAMDDKYGRVGVMKLTRELKHANICISLKEIYDIRNDKNHTTNLIRRLKKKKEATVIILWCERFDALNVLQEAERLQLYHRTWIATEAYGNTDELFTINHKVIQGMFGVIPYQQNYKPFISRLQSITPNTSTRNPWLEDYWTDKQNCVKISNSSGRGGVYRCENDDINLSGLPLNKHVNVMNAVYACAHALHQYVKMVANNTFQINTQPPPLQYVKNVNFTGKDGKMVSFDKIGNPAEANYVITNLHYNVSTHQFHYVNVGSCRCKEGHSVHMNIKGNLQFVNQSQHSCPRSSCAEKCGPGYKGVTFGDLPCCLKCVKCPKGEVQPFAFRRTCMKCEGDSIPNTNHTNCIHPITKILKVNDAGGIALITFVIFGYVIVLTSMVQFYKYRHTAIMNASNKELTWIQLVSFIFLLAFPLIVFIHTVTKLLCTLQNFYFVCFYTVVMSINFTKADRLLRVFNAGKIGILRCRERSNRVQLITVGVLTIFGLLLLTFVHVTLPLSVGKTYHNGSDGTLYITYYCSGYYNTHFLIGLGYIVVIALICGVYAFKAKTLPETFNEAKSTSFAMFIFLLSWIMFVPIYLGTDDHHERRIRWTLMSLVVSVKLFLLMYLKKLYIITFQPDLNTKEHVAGEIKAFNMAIAKKLSD